MLEKYNLKMPHAVYSGENAMDNVTEIIRAEVGKVFAKVLEHAGVYERSENGKKAFLRFVESVC